MKNPLRGLRFSLLDFHSARANVGMKIAMLGIALIPLIYGALYLMAFYDPYGKLDTLPVAVVNEDVPFTTESGDIVSAGDDLVEALRESGAMDYHFLDSEEEAQAGLEDGTYYNTIVIPADFSEKVASAQGDNPEQARLVLECNDANNYLSSILGASVMRQVTAEANYAIGDGYCIEVFQTIKDTGESLGDAADGAGELASGLTDAESGSATITRGLGDALTGAEQLTSGMRAARDGSAQLTDGLSSASDGSSQLSGGIDDASAGADQLASGTRQLADGAAAAGEGSSALAGGLSQLEAGSSQLTDGLSSATAGAQQLEGGLGQLEDGASQLNGGLDQVAGGASSLAGGLGTLSDGASSLADGASGVSAGASQLVGALDAKSG